MKYDEKTMDYLMGVYLAATNVVIAEMDSRADEQIKELYKGVLEDVVKHTWDYIYKEFPNSMLDVKPRTNMKIVK